MIKLRTLFFTIIMLVVPWSTMEAQNDHQAQYLPIVRSGLDYVLELKQYNPKDLIIIQEFGSLMYFRVTDFGEEHVEAYEISPPQFDNPDKNLVKIKKESVSGLLWVKKKKFQSLNIIFPKQLFPDLKTEFVNEKMNTLASEIKELKQEQDLEDYLRNVKAKYPDIVIRRVNNISIAIEGSDGLNTITCSLIYPEEAKMNSTQGIVKIGYVITKDGQVDDIIVIKSLENGCTESVLDCIEELSKKLKEAGYTREHEIYYEAEVPFRLY